MSNGRDFTAIVEAARVHYENLKTDIANSKDRMEHVRLTALAQEAHNLYTDLLVFDVGLVYSHTNNTDRYIEQSGLSRQTTDVPLDLPDFQSPYNPDLLR